MNLHDLTPVIQSSVSPVLMISAVALILLSMTNRYGRVIDVSRRLMDRVDAAETIRERETAISELNIMYSRCRSLRSSITLASLSILMMASLIGTLFIANLYQFELSVMLVILFIASVVFLTASLIVFLVDINASLRVLARDIKDVKRNTGMRIVRVPEDEASLSESEVL